MFPRQADPGDSSILTLGIQSGESGSQGGSHHAINYYGMEIMSIRPLTSGFSSLLLLTMVEVALMFDADVAGA